MQQCERFPDRRIACSGEPSLLLVRQAGDETPQRLERTSDSFAKTASLPVPGLPASRTENCIELASHSPAESFAILTTNIDGNPASTTSHKVGSQAI